MRDCNSEILDNTINLKSDLVLLPDFSCHVLRHTFATRMCESGLNIKVVQPIHGACFADECGYFVLMLKVAGPKDACIFLTDDNRCSIHEANPRACRMYPFVADPSEGDGFRYLVSREYLHHFKGPGVHVRNWLKRYFIVEDREFLRADMGAAREIAALLRQIPETEKATALLHFMRCKYTEYDLDRPFMEQYLRNNEKLLTILRRMADNRKGSQDYE